MADLSFKILGLIALIWLGMAAQLSSQRTISGIIQSEENLERLPFADVVIKDTNKGTSTNVDGYFSLIGAPEDTLTLQIFYVGYQSIDVPIAPGSEDITGLVINLSSEIVLDELVIKANSFKVMNSSDKISTIQISPSSLPFFQMSER